MLKYIALTGALLLPFTPAGACPSTTTTYCDNYGGTVMCTSDTDTYWCNREEELRVRAEGMALAYESMARDYERKRERERIRNTKWWEFWK